MFYSINPEVPGIVGSQSIVPDGNARPPVIQKLHVEFDGWLGDEFLEFVLIYIGTTRLAGLFQQLSPPVSGLEFDEVVVTKSSRCLEKSYLQQELPDFVWFKITGKPWDDDFGIKTDVPRGLIVSQRALHVLQQAKLELCEIEESERAENHAVRAVEK